MNDEKPFIAWDVLIRWTLATTAGLVVSDALGFFIFRGANLFLLDGMIISSIQWWFVLRHRLNKASQWIWVTTGGYAIGLLVAGVGGSIANIIIGITSGTIKGGESVSAGEGTIGIATYLVLYGIVVGLVQYLFFLRRRLNKAGWWIFANMLGYSISFGLFWGVYSPSDLLMTGVLVSVIRGVVLGAVTGFALSWLLQQPRSKLHIGTTESSSERENGI